MSPVGRIADPSFGMVSDTGLIERESMHPEDYAAHLAWVRAAGSREMAHGEP
jgi:hypothetical protein